MLKYIQHLLLRSHIGEIFTSFMQNNSTPGFYNTTNFSLISLPNLLRPRGFLVSGDYHNSVTTYGYFLPTFLHQDCLASSQHNKFGLYRWRYNKVDKDFNTSTNNGKVLSVLKVQLDFWTTNLPQFCQGNFGTTSGESNWHFCTVVFPGYAVLGFEE